MISTELPQGQLIETGSNLIFFGNRNFNWPTEQSILSVDRFFQAEQIHSNLCIEVSKDLLESAITPKVDALRTGEINIGLMIKTADCLPIMISTPQHVLAIHAGWRGLASGILGNTLKSIKYLEEAKAFIGPHISNRHFEVHFDVAGTLQSTLAMKQRASALLPHPDKGKVFLDLAAVARFQLENLGLLRENIWITRNCTFDNSSYHSFRRDRNQSGRNYSLIWRSKR